MLGYQAGCSADRPQADIVGPDDYNAAISSSSHAISDSLVALSLVGGGEPHPYALTEEGARTLSFWVFDRRERLLGELAAEVSVFWTEVELLLKARRDC
jgi:hypothetical protein